MDVKQRIARMGVETMLKMVRSVIFISFFNDFYDCYPFEQEVGQILSNPFISTLQIHIYVSGVCGQLCPRRSPSR